MFFRQIYKSAFIVLCSMVLGLLAAFLNGSEQVLIRNSFAKNAIKSEVFTALSFITAFMLMLLVSPFFFVNPIFTTTSIIGFVGVIISGCIYNILYYKGMKRVRIEKVEPLILSSFIFNVFLSVIFFVEERNLLQVLLSLIAISVVISVHLKEKKLSFTFYEGILLLSAFFVGVHSIFIKYALEGFTPFTLNVMRAGTLAIIFSTLYLRAIPKNKTIVKHLVVLNLVTVTQNILMFWSYDVIGIVMTSLFLSLAPLFAIFGAWIFLKEPIHKKHVMATIVVVGCIVVSLFV